MWFITFPYMCYAQNPSHKNNTGGPERATSPRRRRPENGRGKEKKNNSMAPDSSMYERCPPTPDLTNVLYSIHAPNNQTNFSLSSTPPRSNQRKSDQKQKSWSGAHRALRYAPLRPRRRRAGRSHMPRLRIRASSFSSSSRPPTSSSSFGPRKSPYGTPSNLSVWWIL